MKQWQFLWNESKQKLLDLIKQNAVPLDKINLAFSGGKDSTICLKMIEELGFKNDIKVSFLNTGMEFEASIDFVNKKINEGWNITILRPVKPMMQVYKEYGYPYDSKYASDMIYRLQRHKFNFKEDTYRSFDELYKKYPNCKGALKWLCGTNITLNCSKKLKRWLVFNEVAISNKCCEYLKKKPIKKYIKENGIKINIIGVRKSESLLRNAIYKSCIHVKDNVIDFYPLLYFNDKDIQEVITDMNIELSKAYSLYGMKRTGCIGCPFSKDRKHEMEVLKKYETNKYKTVKYVYKELFKEGEDE